MWRRTISILAALSLAAAVILAGNSNHRQARADDFAIAVGTPGFGLFIGRGHTHVYGPWWGYGPVFGHGYYYHYHRVFHRFGGIHYGPHAAPHIGPYWDPFFRYRFGPHAGPHIDWHGAFGHTGPIVIWGF